MVEEEKTVYFTFGRMNPPTIGHEKLLQSLASKAGKNPYRVYLSQSSDRKKNPLQYKDKVKIARKMFPKYARSIMMNTKVKTAIDAAVQLYEEGYVNLVMVVGSDRIREFTVLLEKYNGQKARHGFYNFRKINVISGGDRDPDAEGVEGMSASKMRDAASAGDFTKFSQGIPKNVSNADTKALYNAVRTGMGLKEAKETTKHIQLQPVSEIRESYVNGELFKKGDVVVVKETGEIAKVKNLGSNYVIVEGSGNTYRKWLDAVEPLQPNTVEYNIAPFSKSLTESVDEASALHNLVQKLRLAPKLDKLVKGYLKYRKKNPAKGRSGVVQFVRQLGPNYELKDADRIIQAMNKLVSQGKLPKHLAIAEENSPQDPDIKDRKGTQPAKYFAKDADGDEMSKSTKSKRDAQFKKQTKMADDDPEAYKPAPGDKGATTKPSKYTKAFKDLYGEQTVDQVRDRISREREVERRRDASDKKRHDSMMDRARAARTRKINRRTTSAR